MAKKILVTGEKVKINDYIDPHHYEIQVNIESSMTIDFCCFGLDSNKKLSDDRYMVFFNQVSSPENAIRLTASDPKKTIFLTHPKKLPNEIKNLVFTASIDGNGTMSNINKGYLALFADSKEILRFDFSGQDFKNERAIIIGEIYFKEVWRLGAVGQGFNGGLSALLKHFGGEEIIDSPSNENLLENGYKYYYGKLNPPLKKAYEAMLEGVKNFSDNIPISQNGEIQTSSISDVIEYMKLDNPSIFYLESSHQYTSMGNEVWFNPKYQFDRLMTQEMENRLSNMAEKILKEVISSSMDDYEKELALHDYLVKNVVYDYESLSIPNPPQEIYSAYGALINRKAVCSGYANAMKLLLDKCGIECLIVSGNSNIPDTDNSIGHAWNIVKINNKFYHLDVTWNAPINRSPGELFHHYFNVTDEEISIDHKWNANTPKCNSNQHNYFTYQGLSISDELTLEKRLKNAIQNKKHTFSFKYTGNNSQINSEKLNAMIKNTWRNRSFLSMQFGSGSLGWNMSYNERQKVFTVNFNHK
ncbi:MAG: TerD family protein [Methylovulum sp.]|nr:TerD family protein [Methylovulum sp.]